MSTLFTKTVEAIDGATADVRGMFGADTAPVARGVRAAGVRHYGRPEWDKMVLEAEKFVDAIIRGRRPIYHFREAMSTDLFPSLFGDSLDRQLYGAYTAAPATWKNYIRRGLVNDFRAVDRFATTGIRGRLSRVEELAPHERRTTGEKKYSYKVTRFEAGFGLSFEAMINDDLDAFARLPQDLAQSAIDTEEVEATELWVDANGPDATFFSTANGNLLSGNPPLTREALQTAITTLMKRKDERNNPIVVTGVELVVGPGLTLAAQQILDATEYRVTDGSGRQTIIRGNGVSANLRLNTNFWLPSLVTTGTVADTMWALFPSVSGTARPAAELGFLRGYETPQLYEKIPNMRRIGGGGEVPWSFEHADSEKKVAHIMGGTVVDERMVVASKGTGS